METIIVDFTRLVTRGLKLAHGARAEAHEWCYTEVSPNQHSHGLVKKKPCLF